ncbi:MAG: hypothetical protein AB7O26_19180, partial [Planctomycetaceae bacterium]
FALAGFFAMFACTNELPAALFGLAMFGLLFIKHPKQTLIWFAPAAALPFAGFLWMTYEATGSWKPFYLSYGTEKYRYVVDGIPSYWMQPKGIDANVESPVRYLLNCLVGHHGIFSLSPIFLVALVGWFSRDSSLRIFRVMGAILSVAVLGFYLTRTENYNYGGVTSGLRWMFWLIPLWLVAMIPALDRWSESRGFRWLCALLLGVSTYSAFWPMNNPWQHPWLYVLMERRGWIDYSTPPTGAEFPHALTAWFPSLPDVAPNDPPAWIEFDVYDAESEPRRLRLEIAGLQEIDGRSVRVLTTRWSGGNAPGFQGTYLIDPKAFESGEPPASILQWPGQAPRDEAKRDAEMFLAGLPQFREYQPGDVRYLFTTLRPEAFACRRAASRVLHEPGGEQQSVWYRTDLWLNDDVPFGVVRRESSIFDATGSMLSRRVYVAVAASKVDTKTIPRPDEMPAN